MTSVISRKRLWYLLRGTCHGCWFGHSRRESLIRIDLTTSLTDLELYGYPVAVERLEEATRAATSWMPPIWWR